MLLFLFTSQKLLFITSQLEIGLYINNKSYAQFMIDVIKRTSPDDDIHDKAVAQQAHHEHHGVHGGDDGDDGRHALLRPAFILIMAHIAAVRVSGHPDRRIHQTVIQEALIVFFKNFYWSALHG